jgi:hypothetical protein
MRSQWGYGSPVGLDCPRSRGRVAGDEREHRRRFDSPAECRVRERGGNGSGLGGRRQSRRSRIPAALLSLSGRDGDHYFLGGPERESGISRLSTKTKKFAGPIGNQNLYLPIPMLLLIGFRTADTKQLLPP